MPLRVAASGGSVPAPADYRGRQLRYRQLL